MSEKVPLEGRADIAVTVLLCTYNGEHYLREQLDSIAAQSMEQVHVIVSDDGSTDGTRAILETYQQAWTKGEFRIVEGPRRGYVANFLSVLNLAADCSDYVALSDQDDIWVHEKLERAISHLQHCAPQTPALYASRTLLVDEHNHEIGLSPLFAKPPSFRNALVQSLAGGNTMVLNRAAQTLVKKAGVPDVPCHDWWIYLLVTGADGYVAYDPWPSLRYRQHTANLIGSNHGMKARVARFKSLLQGQYKQWNDQNIAALTAQRELLTESHAGLLRDFARIRCAPLKTRIAEFQHLHLYRQTCFGQAAMYIAMVLKRF